GRSKLVVSPWPPRRPCKSALELRFSVFLSSFPASNWDSTRTVGVHATPKCEMPHEMLASLAEHGKYPLIQIPDLSSLLARRPQTVLQSVMSISNGRQKIKPRPGIGGRTQGRGIRMISRPLWAWIRPYVS